MYQSFEEIADFCSDEAVGFLETSESPSYQTTRHGIEERDFNVCCCEDIRYLDLLLCVGWMLQLFVQWRWFSQLCI
jgi:hypothetical protein